MNGTTISTLSTVALSVTSTADNPISISHGGGISVGSGLYALAGDSSGFFVPGVFTVSNAGGVLLDAAPNSFGVTLTGGGDVINTGYGVPGGAYVQGTISGSADGVAISGGIGTVVNVGTIQATATSGVGVGLYSGGSVNNSVFQPLPRGAGFPGVIEGGASAAAVRITGGRGTVFNGSTLGAGAAIGVYLGAGGVVTSGNFPTLTQRGTISGTQYGIQAKGASSTVINSGVIIGGTAAVSLPAGYRDLLMLYPRGTFVGAVNGGNTIGAATGSTLELSGYGNPGATSTVAGVGGSITNFATILFEQNDLWVVSGNTAGLAGGETLQGFAAGDRINITGVTGESIVGFSSNTLTLGGGASLDLIIAAGSAATAANFQIYNDLVNGADIITNLPAQACFAAGTRILTNLGEVAVERLRAGDLVITALTGRAVPVVWIGHRRVRPRCHPRPETVQPVVVQPGAFGPGSPHRSLRLSPDHAVFVDGALIPIGLLINDRGITRDDVAEVTYYHVELAEHDILFAEGMTCESYLSTGAARGFDHGGGVVAPHPTFAPADRWETMACAPLLRHGARLDAIRARLDPPSRARRAA